MKIVVLDGHTANPGDLTWECFEKYGEVTVYDRSSLENTVERIGDAQVAITNKTVITEDMMKACPGLKYIGVIATGYNVVDCEAARNLGITVTNVPAYSTEAVAQFTFALLLELTSRVGAYSQSVMEGDWEKSKDFTYSILPLTDLNKKTMGIIGFGSIGQKVAEIAVAFGMRVVVYSRTKARFDEFMQKHQSLEASIAWATKEEVFAKADILSLHCPLFKETEKIVNGETLSLMKPSALIINTARGGCVDEAALAAALNEGRIAGAAVDTVAAEPILSDNPLLRARNMLITPHIAWAAHEIREKLLNIAGENLGAYVEGSPVNVVN